MPHTTEIPCRFLIFKSKYYADTPLLHDLSKRWLEELRDDIEEPLQAVFHFNNLVRLRILFFRWCIAYGSFSSEENDQE
jgi:hypothetical protein